MTSESRNSRKSRPDDWSIGRTHCAKRTLSTRNDERCNFSWISWRSSSSPPLSLPQPPVSPSRLPAPLLSQLLPSHPFDLAACSCHPHEDRLLRSQARVVSVRAEACKQVRWMHSVHSTGFSSSSSITRRPLLHLLRACVLLSLSVSLPFPHVLSAFSVHVSSRLVLSRLFLLFRSALQSGFFHEDLRFSLRGIIAGNRSPRCRR